MSKPEEHKIKVHSKLIDSLVRMSTVIKLHKMVEKDGNPFRLSRAQAQMPLPSYQEIVTLLDNAAIELSQCTKPVNK